MHGALTPESRGQLVMLATGSDRTLYFDFLPVKAKIHDFTVRLQLYTVPGQVHYNATRKLVLNGADGIIFVADSQRNRLTANEESLTNLEENLAEQGLSLKDIPFVIQYNKRDVPDIVPVPELDARLNRLGVPAFESVASKRQGVFEALKEITKRVLDQMQRRGAVKVSSATARRTPVRGVPIVTPGAAAAGGGPAARDTSLADSLQGAAEAMDRVGASAPPAGPAPGPTPTPTATPSISGTFPAYSSTRGRVVLDDLLGRKVARDGVTALEQAIEAGDFANAVTRAGAGCQRIALELAGGRPAGEARLLAALRTGLPASGALSPNDYRRGQLP